MFGLSQRDRDREAERQRWIEEEIREIHRRMENFIPREQHFERWKADDLRYNYQQKQLDTIGSDVKTLLSLRLPAGFVAFLGPIMVAILAHFWK